ARPIALATRPAQEDAATGRRDDRLARSAPAPVQEALSPRARPQRRLRSLPRTDRRKHAALPVVRRGSPPSHRRHATPPALSSLPARAQSRLAILPLVLGARLRGGER